MITKSTSANAAQKRALQADARARRIRRHVGSGLVGLVLIPACLLEYFVTRNTAELILRGWSGELPEGSGLLITVLSLVFCLTSIAWLHRPVGAWRVSRTGRMTFWIFFVAILVTLSQPAIGFLNDLPMGNSLELTANAGLLLKQNLLTAGYIVRAVSIVMGAITSSYGVHMVLDAVRNVDGDLNDRRVANEIGASVGSVSAVYKDAYSQRDAAMAYNRIRAREFAVAVAHGFRQKAAAIARYMKDANDPFFHPEQLMEELDDQADSPIERSSDPDVVRMVSDRLEEHGIDIRLLPSSPSLLSKAARAQLLAYAKWLNEHADVDAIYEATRYNMEMPHA